MLVDVELLIAISVISDRTWKIQHHMTFFYKFWKKARVYYTLGISRGGGPSPPGPPWIRHRIIR